ncbi:DUF6489 family protein [Zhongshania aliphaticivorans]|uniref:DUF6489 family protein n=1 Tax=Zhongshania aliphaticivorans TaxID=1470434 RepID=UPI0012E470F9|nr:DUF6489 family protein [Zhongshania aliphaticivorans]CAA0093033.1 Uncharacterised protein [Zhongshania aliphaticivorans]
MKIHVEVEISPEEMRRLVGLPDAQPLWDAVYKRIGEGDSEMIQQMAKTAFTEGMKTIDLSARVLKSLSGLASNRKATDKTTTKDDADSSDDTATKPSARKATSARRSASSKS